MFDGRQRNFTYQHSHDHEFHLLLFCGFVGRRPQKGEEKNSPSRHHPSPTKNKNKPIITQEGAKSILWARE